MTAMNNRTAIGSAPFGFARSDEDDSFGHLIMLRNPWFRETRPTRNRIPPRLS